MVKYSTDVDASEWVIVDQVSNNKINLVNYANDTTGEYHYYRLDEKGRIYMSPTDKDKPMIFKKKGNIKIIKLKDYQPNV